MYYDNKVYYLLWQLIIFISFKPPLEPGTVLYEAELSQFAEDIRKWKDRYIVVKNDFAVESYENKEVTGLPSVLAIVLKVCLC